MVRDEREEPPQGHREKELSVLDTKDTDRMSTKTKQELQDAWIRVRKAKQEAIEIWARKTSEAIRVTIMAKNPKLTWIQISVLEAGLPGYHKKLQSKRYMDENGTEATNDSEAGCGQGRQPLSEILQLG